MPKGIPGRPFVERSAHVRCLTRTIECAYLDVLHSSACKGGYTNLSDAIAGCLAVDVESADSYWTEDLRKTVRCEWKSPHR